MRILVISDTHRDLVNARIAIKDTSKSGLDGVIHCGDHIDDAKKLEKEFPELWFNYVPGNCDGWFFTDNEKNKVIEVENKKIFITHGDCHNIKYDYDELIIDVKAHDAAIGLCGHTHIAHIQKEPGATIVNPGSITLPRDLQYPSYAILEISEDNSINVIMMMIKDSNSCRHFFW